MHKTKLALSFAFPLHLITVSYAQVYVANDTLKLTLRELWHKAEEHSKVVALKKIQLEVTEEEVKDAITERYPELGIYGSAEKATNIPIYKRGIFEKPSQHEVIHTLYKVGVDFYLNLYNGNKTTLEIKEERILSHLAAIENEQTISSIRLEATSLFLDLQKSMIFLGLISDDIKNQEKQLAEITTLYRNGTVLKSDVLRVELDLSKRKLLLVEIENDILIATQKLNIIIGEPDDRPISVEQLPEVNEPDATRYDEFLAMALQHSYAYHISHQHTELSKVNLRKIRSNVRPSIGLYSEFYYANPQIFLFPYNPYWYSLGVAGIKGSFPISSIYHNRHKERAARLELEKEEVAHHEVEDRVRQKVNEAYLRYREALVHIKVAEVNVQQADENARIVKNAYFNHTALITDLLDADIQVLRSKFELASARIMAQNRCYALKDIVGIL